MKKQNDLRRIPLSLAVLVAGAIGLSNLPRSGIFAFGAIKNLVASPAQAAQTKTYRIRVDGMTCPFCAATSEKALKAIPGVKSVSTNLKKGVISVCAAPSANLTSGKMKSLFASKGFTFRSMRTGNAC